jgi:hypothetical protein
MMGNHVLARCELQAQVVSTMSVIFTHKYW